MTDKTEETMMNTGFFEYANYLALRKAIEDAAQGGSADAKEDSGSLAKYFDNVHEYVKVVDVMETSRTIYKARFKGRDYQTCTDALDQSRHAAHEAAATSVYMINRLAKSYGVGPIFTGDAGVRDKVEDFCLECTAKIFAERRR